MGGKPALAHVIETLRCVSFLSGIHVSTDDAEIAEIAEGVGASCLGPRSPELSDDRATFIDLIRQDIPRFQSAHPEDHEVLFVLATAALLPAQIYEDACRVWLDKRPDVLMSCEPNFPWFAMTQKDDGFWSPVFPDKVLRNTQDLPRCVVDAGLFYFFDQRVVTRNRSLKLVDRLMPYLVPMQYRGDIDTLEDWEELERKFLLRR